MWDLFVSVPDYCLSFYLVNSHTTYQRLMNHMMSPLLYETYLVYHDDCIVYSKTFEDHIERLNEILTRIGKATLKFLPKKFHLLNKHSNSWDIPSRHEVSPYAKIRLEP